jgi:hypothetical protein
MRNITLLLNSSVALGLLVGLPGQAIAQSAASTAPMAAASAMPAVPATPATTTAPETAPPAAPASEAPAAAIAPAESAAASVTPATPPAETPPASYFRIDDDYAFGIQLWAGATHPLGDGIGLASDIYIAEYSTPVYKSGAGAIPGSWYGEFDLGPAFTFGPLSLTPMAGIGFDWAAKHVNALNAPQLYTIVNLDKIYFESWIWTLLYSPFKEQAAANQFHTRDWVLYKLSGTLGIGPQLELWYNLQNFTRAFDGGAWKKGVAQMPIGGHVEIAYGTGNSLGLFVGYDANKEGRVARGGNAAVGRFTFVHNF